MNIFVLDISPKKAAEYHCDKHVVKMITETAQILSTVLNIKDDNLYKSTHINHPCTKWVKESKENFEWLLELGINLGLEYTKRYNKIHKSSLVIDYIKSIYLNHINLRCFLLPCLKYTNQTIQFNLIEIIILMKKINLQNGEMEIFLIGGNNKSPKH